MSFLQYISNRSNNSQIHLHFEFIYSYMYLQRNEYDKLDAIKTFFSIVDSNRWFTFEAPFLTDCCLGVVNFSVFCEFIAFVWFLKLLASCCETLLLIAFSSNLHSRFNFSSAPFITASWTDSSGDIQFFRIVFNPFSSILVLKREK